MYILILPEIYIKILPIFNKISIAILDIYFSNT